MEELSLVDEGDYNRSNNDVVMAPLLATSESTVKNYNTTVYKVCLIFIVLIALAFLVLLIYAAYATFSEKRLKDCEHRDVYSRSVSCTSNLTVSNDANIGGTINSNNFAALKMSTPPLVLDDVQHALDGSRSFIIVEHDQTTSTKIILPSATQFAGMWIIITNRQSHPNLPLIISPPSSDLVDNVSTSISLEPHQVAFFVANGPLPSGQGNWTRLK
jgi:hypothetical protein